MPWQHVLWNDEPGGNVDKVAQHGLTVKDVNHVLKHPEGRDVSRSTGESLIFGDTPDGRRIVVVFEDVDGITFVPSTAYEVPRR